MTLSLITTLLAQQTPSVSDAGNIFSTLVQWFGVPGALMVVFIYAQHKGWIILGREATNDVKDALARVDDWKARYTEMDARWGGQYKDNDERWTGRYTKMEEEKNFWRDQALRNMEALEKTVDTAQKAVDKLPTDSKPERS